MKSSIATVSISGSFSEKLAAISRAGFDGIEIFENDFLAFDATPRQVGGMVRDHGLEITLFQPFRDFEGMPDEQRRRAFERAERKFDLMGELGAPLLLVCSNTSPLALGGIDRAAADLRELGERAARHGLKIGYEALAWGRHVSDHRDAWEVVRRADHPAVGLILDSFHTLTRGIDPASIRAIPGDRIAMVQLADAPRIQMDLLYLSRHFRNMPGEGDLDLVAFMRAIAATGYAGALSLEIFNDQFRSGSPRAIAVDGRRSLLALMDKVSRLEPGGALAPPSMPPRIPVAGTGFVEFAADDAEAAELGRMLHALGFARTGRHIAKDVDLWQQGDARIVVNTDREGFAHSSHLVHGLGVCDIGLMVDDATATVQRAEALLAETFEQPVGPGEMRIPAIRGVGGSVLHFIDRASGLDRIWETEFRPVPEGGPAMDAGITGIDHIAQTMNQKDMLTWVLFYTSIFETEKTPVVDVVDPAGLVRSQVIENGSGTFRMTLNGAENRNTLAGHFMTESFGSAIQHIAFSCRDIFAASAALAANGFKPLDISPNYYNDLDARFGLDGELLDRLRTCRILYDRDEHGEYFQIYGPVFGEGMFFEIVERRGAYNGYGAPNAPFRIAAQKRAMRPAGMPRF